MVNDYNTNHNQNFSQDPFSSGTQSVYQIPETPIKKRRKGLASFICFILGFVMLGLGIIISLKTGVFASGVIGNVVKESNMIGILEEEMKKEIGIEYTDAVSQEMEKTLEKVVDYVENTFETGEAPKKEEIREDIQEVFDAVVDIYTKDILDEIQSKGEISIDELENLEAGKLIIQAIGDEAFDKVKEELKVEFGNTVKVDENNRKELEQIVTDGKDSAEVKEILDEATDGLHTSLVELTDTLKFDDSDEGNMFEVMNTITSVVSTALVIGIVVAVVLILLAALIDRDLSMTLRGMFGPLFVPGLLIAILGFAVNKLYAMAIESSLETDLKEEAVRNVAVTLGDIAITPFIVTGCVMLGCAIVFKVVGCILRKKEVA